MVCLPQACSVISHYIPSPAYIHLGRCGRYLLLYSCNDVHTTVSFRKYTHPA